MQSNHEASGRWVHLAASLGLQVGFVAQTAIVACGVGWEWKAAAAGAGIYVAATVCNSVYASYVRYTAREPPAWVGALINFVAMAESSVVLPAVAVHGRGAARAVAAAGTVVLGVIIVAILLEAGADQVLQQGADSRRRRLARHRRAEEEPPKTDPTLEVQEPWFTQIRLGRKTVEGRVGPAGKFGGLVGRVLRVAGPGGRRADALVVGVRHHDTLAAYLAAEGWEAVAPHTGSAAAAAAAYAAVRLPDGEAVFAPERVARRGGIEAIELDVEEDYR